MRFLINFNILIQIFCGGAFEGADVGLAVDFLRFPLVLPALEMLSNTCSENSLHISSRCNLTKTTTAIEIRFSQKVFAYSCQGASEATIKETRLRCPFKGLRSLPGTNITDPVDDYL